MSDKLPDKEMPQVASDEAQPLTGEPVSEMRLRPGLPPVTRLSRKVLLGLGLAASAGLGGALIYALQSSHGGKVQQQAVAADNRATPDGLANLPKDYAGVPKLGPPLPGDLGRPILSAQSAGQTVTPPTMGNGQERLAAQAQMRQQRAQAMETIRSAQIFTRADTGGAASGGTPAGSGAPASAPVPNLASLGLAPPASTPTAQERQNSFLTQAPDRRTATNDRIEAPPSADVLQAGAVIPAALITGIRSDLPGQITAQVTQNVYDSPTGHILLVPQGTRVIGQYDNAISFGQRRVLLVWNRLIFPNGRSIVLERQPGADAQGYAGLEDGVDFHLGQLFKAAALSTILSVGAEAGTSQNENSLAQALRAGAANSFSQTGEQIVSRELNIAPTLTIRPGFPVRVMVTHDLILEPYGG